LVSVSIQVIEAAFSPVLNLSAVIYEEPAPVDFSNRE
jgi:hypothetical protein